MVEVADPHPIRGEVLVEVSACGVCGSDLSSFKHGLFTGSVPGHELAGVVAEVGSEVQGWSEGDRVAVDPKTPCGSCADCDRGASHRCTSALTAGIGFQRQGGWAERVSVPAHLLHRLPAELATEDACLVEPLSVALHGIAQAGVVAGSASLLVGLGPIGLLAVAGLRAAGAAPIVGVDPMPARRALAHRLGADETLADVREVGRILPAADVVLECSGDPAMLGAAAALTGGGGRLVLLGIPIAEASVYPVGWVIREIHVIGSIASSTTDFHAAIDQLASTPAIASVVTRRVSLEELPEAVEGLLGPSGDAKLVVDPRL